jgi:tRNA U34 5-methylaminomethyl-2-thiouridine-forming methyltransferase MnmC
MKLITTADGSETFLNEEVGESYHSQTGAVEEAFKKYTVPCRIKGLARKGNIRILDICFGMGYNSAAAIDVALAENPDCQIEVIGLENNMEIVNKIKEINPPIKSYKLFKKLIGQENLELKENNISIKVLLGDARETIKKLKEDSFDTVFMDPFSPKTAPEMWGVDFFKEIFRVIKEKRILATYTCARIVRENMKEVGFNYDDGPIVGRRGPGTIAWKEDFL